MNRTHNCGELSIENVGQTVTLTGWVHSSTPLNDTVLVDLRDTRGVTRLVVDTLVAEELVKAEQTLGRDWAQVTGVVVERQYKNPETKTGDIEIRVSEVKILNNSHIINFPLRTLQVCSSGVPRCQTFTLLRWCRRTLPATRSSSSLQNMASVTLR